jgi:hypothetical protein
MSIYKFAPKAVINSLTSTTRSILETRISNDVLKPYYHLEYNIRIRGLKPSILYTKYTTLNEQNELQTMYVADAEEEQCEWINSLIKRIKTTNQDARIDIFIRSMTEMAWCTWEDKFMYTSPIVPLPHLHGYIDYLNNTFSHCVAYACTNRTPVDINEVEIQFQALKFTENQDLYLDNDLGETPLKILLDNEELVPYVESLLIRLPKENRLKALKFNHWHKTWDSLMNTITDDPAQLRIIIRQTKKQRGFLAIFMNLTYNSKDALKALFRAGYKIQGKHHYNDRLTTTQSAMIVEVLEDSPDWHNLTVWMYRIIKTKPYSNNLQKIKHFIQMRNSLIFEKIVTRVMDQEFLNGYMLEEGL